MRAAAREALLRRSGSRELPAPALLLREPTLKGPRREAEAEAEELWRCPLRKSPAPAPAPLLLLLRALLCVLPLLSRESSVRAAAAAAGSCSSTTAAAQDFSALKPPACLQPKASAALRALLRSAALAELELS
jgi:hypothetical protein